MKKYYWIQPGKNSHQYGITAKEQAIRIDRGMSEYGQVCNLQMIRTTDRRRAHYKFQFYTAAQMKNSSGTPLAALYDGGVVGMNTTRKIGLEKPGNRYVEALSLHEVGHGLGFMDGKHDHWGHQTNRDRIMSPDLTAYSLNYLDVWDMQRAVGKPKKIFYPIDKGIIGKKLRVLDREYVVLAKERKELIAVRTDIIKNGGNVHPIQKRVLANLAILVKTVQKIKPLHKAWWVLKKNWVKIPFAG